jgi:hypothetical protein
MSLSSRIELFRKLMAMAASEVANGTMSCREAAEHYSVDPAVLVHVAEKKMKDMLEQQRTGTYK